MLTIYLYWIEGILRGYAIQSGRCPSGSQRPGRTALLPLTSLGTSAWPYRVTMQVFLLYALMKIIDIKKINIERKAPQNVRESQGVFNQVSRVPVSLSITVTTCALGWNLHSGLWIPQILMTLFHFVSPTTIGHSPHDYFLTHWSLGDLDVIFKMQFRHCFPTWYLQILLW